MVVLTSGGREPLDGPEVVTVLGALRRRLVTRLAECSTRERRPPRYVLHRLMMLALLEGTLDRDRSHSKQRASDLGVQPDDVDQLGEGARPLGAAGEEELHDRAQDLVCAFCWPSALFASQ
jgi:hypothetical protein